MENKDYALAKKVLFEYKFDGRGISDSEYRELFKNIPRELREEWKKEYITNFLDNFDIHNNDFLWDINLVGGMASRLNMTEAIASLYQKIYSAYSSLSQEQKVDLYNKIFDLLRCSCENKSMKKYNKLFMRLEETLYDDIMSKPLTISDERLSKIPFSKEKFINDAIISIETAMSSLKKLKRKYRL